MSRKPTGILDQQEPAAREAIYAHCSRVELADGVKWLRSEWAIEISDSTLSKWLATVRMDKAFTARLAELAAANERAGVMGATLADALKLTKAGATLASQAFLDAQISGDPRAIKAATSALVAVIKPLLKAEDQRVKDEALELDRKKYDDARKTKIEAGLDALFVQIKGNDKAVAAFNQLKAAIAS